MEIISSPISALIFIKPVFHDSAVSIEYYNHIRMNRETLQNILKAQQNHILNLYIN
jgi:hypothetical protein